MPPIQIYCPNYSARLVYVLDWLFRERLQVAYRVINNWEESGGQPVTIAYGAILPGSICIPDQGLLWETGIAAVNMETGLWNGLPVLFYEPSADYSLTFDLFSAIFYLLSRHEEYTKFEPDKHGRYPATASILYKNNWLQRPIVDEWVTAFGHSLIQRGIPVNPTAYKYLPTYDIDIAYSHLHKGEIRTAGAMVRSASKGKMHEIKDRIKTVTGRQADPFDSFDWISGIHLKLNIKPLFFWLCAISTSAFDKNISPDHPAMKSLIGRLSGNFDCGLHPSYFSDKGSRLTEEKNKLECMVGNHIQASRQHYIRFHFPHTCHLLLEHGITDDYTMGYGSHLGFRAGTGSSFMWFDLDKNAVSTLRLHPFCFMDTTAHYELNLDVETSFRKLKEMEALLKQNNSTLVTIFHNFSLGSAVEWKGWKKQYELFLQNTANK